MYVLQLKILTVCKSIQDAKDKEQSASDDESLFLRPDKLCRPTRLKENAVQLELATKDYPREWSQKNLDRQYLVFGVY